ncbi:hypothetical protein PQX77_018742 [Marasmius sp. AFHP31]|nr:hypothetical protein PQX77_018742 [Marasmius sp. AFHP31]
MEAKPTAVVLRQDSEVDIDTKLEEYHDLGLWRMFIEKDAESRAITTRPETLKSPRGQANFVVLRRFFRDMITIAAAPVGLSVLGHFVGGIVPVVEGILESRILRIDGYRHVIEQRVKSTRVVGDKIFGISGAEDNFIAQHASLGATTVRNLRSVVTAVIVDCVDYMPMFCYALRVIRNPLEISLATISTLQTSMLSIRRTCANVLRSAEELNQAAVELKGIYDLEVVNNVVKDEGQISFPLERSSEEGVALELRNVSFRYPGSQNTTGALDDVSFKVGAGELIVVVGANGSGTDIKKYKLPDIRRAVAILTQDQQVIPGISLKENIGLGDVSCAEDETEERIGEAVRKGGAEGVIGKLEKGVDTVLYSRVVRYSQLLDEEDETNPLAIKFKQLQKTSNVSGGERQRLVA